MNVRVVALVVSSDRVDYDLRFLAAGCVDGFKYSKAMKESGLVWDEANLTAYLTKPKEFLPGNKMPFPGLKKPEQIENVIAYIIEKSK